MEISSNQQKNICIIIIYHPSLVGSLSRRYGKHDALIDPICIESANKIMNSNVRSTSSTSLADLEAERDRLRAECSTLFDHKRAIEIQMAEIQSRLQWLDDKIDGTGVGDGLAEAGGRQKRKFDNAMPTVKFEVIDKDNSNGKKNSRLGDNSTQPEEYLTDPHTQLGDDEYLTHPILERDDGNHRGKFVGDTADNARRISTSPPLQLVHSKTPPGLKPSANTAPLKPTASVTVANRATDNNLNPFVDLWNSDESNNHRNTLNDGSSTKRGASSVNTLDMYFNGTKSHNSMNTTTASNIQSTINHKNESYNNNTHRFPWSDRMLYHLRNTFRINNFRDHQEEIINVTMQGQDAFVVMRTGGGKSLTYQLPAVIESESTSRKVTVVISPLISLIRDQEEQMNQLIPGSAMSFTSSMAGGTTEHARRWGLVRDASAGVALIFITPEKVGKSTKLKGEMEKLHNSGRLGRFVVDEW